MAYKKAIHKEGPTNETKVVCRTIKIKAATSCLLQIAIAGHRSCSVAQRTRPRPIPKQVSAGRRMMPVTGVSTHCFLCRSNDGHSNLSTDLPDAFYTRIKKIGSDFILGQRSSEAKRRCFDHAICDRGRPSKDGSESETYRNIINHMDFKKIIA